MYVCALCGRPMDRPAAMIGTRAIGPKCAKKAGLLKRTGLAGKVTPVKIAQDDQTLDLFAGLDHGA